MKLSYFILFNLLFLSVSSSIQKFELIEAPLQFISSYGFLPGGTFNITGQLTFFNVDQSLLLNRTMSHLLICDETVVNISPPSSSTSSRSSAQREQESQTKWRYCTGGAYNDLELCDSIPFIHNQTSNDDISSMVTKYTEKISSIGQRNYQHVAYFFVTNCEIWGTHLGGTRDRQACGPESQEKNSNNDNDNDNTKASSTSTQSSSSMNKTTGGISYPCQHMEPSRITLDIEINYKNPNGYLSFTEIPFVSVYLAFVPLWFILTILWEYNIWKYARRSHVVTLQKKMALVPVLRLVAVSVTMILWMQRDQNGGDNNLLLVVLILVQVVYKCILAEVMLLISKGWQITRSDLHIQEERNIRALLMLYSFAWALYYLSSTTLRPTNGTHSEEGLSPDGRNMKVAFVGLIVLTIMFLVILYSVWYSVSMQLNVLSYQINLIRAYNINPRTTPVWIKFQMLKLFRQAFAIYLMLNAIADIMMANSRSIPWAPALADEILEFIVCAVIGFTFRARNFSPYFERIRRASLDPAAQNNGNGNGNDTNDNPEQLRLDNGMREWTHGMPLPSAPPHMFHPSRSNIVIMENPNGRRESLGSTNVNGVSTPTSPGSFFIKSVNQPVNEIEMGSMSDVGGNAVEMGGNGITRSVVAADDGNMTMNSEEENN